MPRKKYDKPDTGADFLQSLEQLADQFAALAEKIDPPDEAGMRLHDGNLDLWSGPSRSYSLQLPDKMVAVIDELRRRGDPIVSRSEIVRHLLAEAIDLVTSTDPAVVRFLAARAGRLDEIDPQGNA